MATPTHSGARPSPRYPAGERLQCHNCGSVIAITSPCPCDPPDQVFQCCGQDMKPTTGQPLAGDVE